jgi:hypothetical protein
MVDGESTVGRERLNLAAQAAAHADDEDVRAELGAAITPRFRDERAIRVIHRDQPFRFWPRFLPAARRASRACSASRTDRCAGVSSGLRFLQTVEHGRNRG